MDRDNAQWRHGEASWTAAERRGQPRRAVLWRAEIETGQGDRVTCAVLDISVGGAKVKPQQRVLEGEIVTLTGDRLGTHRGRIAWTTEASAGLQFLATPTDPTTSKFRPF